MWYSRLFTYRRKLMTWKTRIQIYTFIIFVSITILLGNTKQADDIRIEGKGTGANETKALISAKRDAVEKGIKTIIISQTEIKNFMVKRDMVITKTMGSIKNYKILSKNKATDMWEVRINAVISSATMREDLTDFHILLESMEKPKVMVIIKESNIGNIEPTNNAAENTIIKFLKTPYDFDLVNPDIVASIKSSEQKMANLASDAESAASIGSMYGAEVLITGTAISRIAEKVSDNLGGMKSVQADVTLRAINCTTGRIIASKNGHGAKVHISPNTAGVNAISMASDKAVKTLLDDIIVDWNRQIDNGVPLIVSIKNVGTFRAKNAAIQTLKSISGVTSVNERGWNGESRLLKADVQYMGNSNSFCSKTKGYKMTTGGGSFGVTAQNGTRISLIIQAK